MSIKITSLVWDNLPYGGGELLLALALADFSDDDGRSIFPSIPLLAKKTRLHERTVQRHLAEFRHAGWLILETPGGMIEGKKRATTYRINVDWIRRRGGKLPPVPDRGGIDDAEGRHPVRGGVASCTDRGGMGATLSVIGTTIEPSEENRHIADGQKCARGDVSWSSPDTPAGHRELIRKAFTLVQATYPAGMYGGNAWLIAERNFGRLIDDGLATAAELVEAATAYRDQQQAIGKIGTQYVRSPAKFYDPHEAHWRGPFPKPRTKAESKQDANIAAGLEWLSRSEAATDG